MIHKRHMGVPWKPFKLTRILSLAQSTKESVINKKTWRLHIINANASYWQSFIEYEEERI